MPAKSGAKPGALLAAAVLAAIMELPALTVPPSLRMPPPKLAELPLTVALLKFSVPEAL